MRCNGSTRTDESVSALVKEWRQSPLEVSERQGVNALRVEELTPGDETGRMKLSFAAGKVIADGDLHEPRAGADSRRPSSLPPPRIRLPDSCLLCRRSWRRDTHRQAETRSRWSEQASVWCVSRGALVSGVSKETSHCRGRRVPTTSSLPPAQYNPSSGFS